MTMNNKIYIYTTNSDRQKGRYKFGQTEQDVIDRIKGQQTGNSEKLQKVMEIETGLTDFYIRYQLRLMGYAKVNQGGGSEWFEGFKSDEEAILGVSKIISKEKNDTRVEYTPRFFQTVMKNNFLKKYQSELEKKYEFVDFALELAPRFGKTIWVIDLLKTLFEEFNIKLCVIPSYVLTSNSSFEKEFYFFKKYSDCMVLASIDENLNDVIRENYGKKLILIPASLHMREHEDKLEIIKNLPSKDKVSIIDEADFGAHRNNSQDKIDFINCGLNVYMTGTAIEKVIYPLKNVRDNILRWSYSDMLMVKYGEHPLQDNLESIEESKNSVKDIVIPQFMRLSLGGVIDKFYDVEPKYRTDWTKLLSDVDKSKPILTDLIKSLFGVYNGKLTYLVDLNTSEICPKDVTMIFANTPDKKEQKKLHKLLGETLGPQYIVELINGDETSNKEAEELAKGVVARAKRERKKVVFLSKSMASRSFSVSEIDTVMLMFDRGSYSTVAQKISRVLTPGNTYDESKKVSGNIISLSLDPNREDVSPIDEYLVYEAEKTDVNELSDGINRVLRSVNIFVNENGLMEPIIIDEYANKLINSSELIRIGMDIVKVDSVMNDAELVRVLTGIEINNQTEKEKIDGVDSSTIIRTEKEKTKKDKNKGEATEDERQKLKESLSNIVENIVEISEINNCESNNIIETLEMIRDKGFCEEVVFEVGVDCEIVKKVILLGAVSEKLLNTIITSYNNEENGVIINQIGSSLSKWKSDPSKGEVFTPSELVNQMLDKIPEEVWRNPKSLFLDPCMGKGTFLIEIVNRLVYIYKYSEEDAKSRVYGYDVRVKYINYLRRRGFINVQCKDFLNEEIKMRFDVILGNVPFQEKVGETNTEPIWDKFVLKSFELVKEKGFVSLIHPSGWRSPKGRFKKIQNLLRSKKIHFLSLNDFNAGQKIFKVGTNFDFYCIQNINDDSEITKVNSIDNENFDIDLNKFSFIPNGMFELFNDLIAKDNDEKVILMHSESFYAHRKEWMSKEMINDFQYPCVYSITKNNGLKFYYSRVNDKGHFGIPKVIWSNGLGTYPIIDEEGEYGLMEYSFGIVDTLENLEKIKIALNSEKMLKLMTYVRFTNNKYDNKVIATFKKDFWRHFIDE
jgi:hypothetical protein